MTVNVWNQVRCSLKAAAVITAVHTLGFPPVIFKCKCSSFCSREFLLLFPLCLFWPHGRWLHTQWQVQSRVKTADKSVSGLISCLHVSTPVPGTPLLDSLTSFTVLPSKSKRAVATEGAPEVHAGSSVHTRVDVAEMSFGRASWEGEKIRGWFICLISPSSLFHQSSRVRG